MISNKGGMKKSNAKQPISPNQEKNGVVKRWARLSCSAEKWVMANHINR